MELVSLSPFLELRFGLCHMLGRGTFVLPAEQPEQLTTQVLRIIDRINGLTRRQSLLARPDTAAVTVDRGVDPLERARGQVDLPASGTIADDADLAVEIRQGAEIPDGAFDISHGAVVRHAAGLPHAGAVCLGRPFAFAKMQIRRDGRIAVVREFAGDLLTGQPRFNYGWMELADGVGVVPLIMGVFGIAEVLVNIEDMTAQDVYETRIKGLFPTRRDWADSKWPIARGTAIGFFLGLLPGGGPIIASFSSYAIEKRLSKHPEKFGTGIIEGVAGPESANNAATASGYVPLFLIGIPTNGVMAMLFSALLIHGLQPGPLILKDHPEIFWGTVMSMYLGNVMLLVLNLPLIGLWIKILKIPYQILFPLILSFCIIGAYSINNSVIDVVAMLVFGVVGYLMRKFRYEGAPLILAFVLGPLLERAFVQSLNMSAGSYSIFFNEPISAVTLTIAFVLVLLSALSVFRKMAAEG